MPAGSYDNTWTWRPPTAFERFSCEELTWQVGLHLVVDSSGDEPLTEYADEPERFALEVLGVELWAVQGEIARSILTHPRVAVASCYGAGKTFLAAALAIWWLTTRRPACVVTTAPTGRQVKKLLWREIAKLWGKAKRKLPGKRPLQVEWTIAPDWLAFGFSADNPVGAQGFHEPNTLVIEDEASGIDQDMSDTLEGAMVSEGCRRLKIGNPIVTDGPFYDCFFKYKAKSERDLRGWKTFNISAFDTPNVKAGKVVVNGLTTKGWIADARVRFGADSQYWRTRVLGQFPTDMADKLIPMDWIRQAQERWKQMADGLPRRIGADIGRGKDRTAILKMLGRRIHVVKCWAEPDTMKSVAGIVKAIEDTSATEAVVDETAVGGGVLDRIKQMKVEAKGRPQGEQSLSQCKVYGVFNSRKPHNRKKFDRISDELWWLLREALHPDPTINPDPIGLPPDDDLAQQLNCRQWRVDAKDKIKVETKNELRRRGVKSPDAGDALSLLMYKPKELVVR